MVLIIFALIEHRHLYGFMTSARLLGDCTFWCSFDFGEGAVIIDRLFRFCVSLALLLYV
ncbi:unnamed protein product [Calypogeia fissa]